MRKFKLRANSIMQLNEALKKAAIYDEIVVSKSPLLEADGKFVSVLQSENDIDASKIGSNIEIEEDLMIDSPEKQELTTLAIDKIKTSLKTNSELQEILDKISSLNNVDNKNEWVVNEEGNTATLTGKGARIFKQNNNLCISYKDNIKVVSSVSELHDFLRQKQLPLPKDIVLHESLLTEVIHKNSPWHDIIYANATNAGYMKGDEILPEVEPGFDIENASNEEVAASRIRNQRNLDNVNKTDVLTKPIGKMGKDEYKDRTKYMTNDEKDPFNYLHKKSSSPSKYVDVISGIFEEVIDECFSGVTTGTLGTAVQYLGDQKEECNIQPLEEGKLSSNLRNLFPGVASEKSLAKKYLNWVYATNPKTNKPNVDPDHDINFPLALKVLGTWEKADEWFRIKKNFVKHGLPDPETGKLIPNKTKDQIIADLKSLIGEDISFDPEQSISGKYNKGAGFTKDERYLEKISVGNEEALNRYKEYWVTNEFPKHFEKISAPFIAKRDNYLNKDVIDTSIKNEPNTSSFFPDLEDAIDDITGLAIRISNNETDSDEFVSLFQGLKKTLSPEQLEGALTYTLSQHNNPKAEIPLTLDDDTYEYLEFLLKKISTAKQEGSFIEQFEYSLKEDDSPEDFAKGPAIDIPETPTDTPDTTIDDTVVAPDLESDIPNIDGESGNVDVNMDFGGISPSLSGSYAPDSEEDPMSMVDIQPEPEFRVIDVLVNPKDDTDISVEVENLETGEKEIRKLTEIDI